MHDVANGFVASSNEMSKVFRDKFKLHDLCLAIFVLVIQ